MATGSGHTALRLAPLLRAVIASDLAPGMVARAQAEASARKLRNVVALVADVHALPFADAGFDLVTCRIAPHHFADLPRAMREVRRILRPGGRFVVEDSLRPDDPALADFLHRFEVLRDHSHKRSLSDGEWHETLLAARLEPTDVRVVDKSRDYETWCARGTMTPKDRVALDEHVRNAPRAVREHFLEIRDDGSIGQFGDQKVLLKALAR